MGRFTEWSEKYNAEFRRWDMAGRLDDKAALNDANEKLNALEIDLSQMMTPSTARRCDAAEDMIEALKESTEMLQYVHEHCDTMKGLNDCHCKIAKAWRKDRAAIKKAKGDTK